MKFRDILWIVGLTVLVVILASIVLNLPTGKVTDEHSVSAKTRPTTYENGTRLNVDVRGERWNVFIHSPTDQWTTRLNDLDALGQTACDGSYAIHIAPSLPYFVQKETIFHELLHAGTCGIDGTLYTDYFNSPREGNHPGIDRIAAFTTTLLQDNPELAHYLIDK